MSGRDFATYRAMPVVLDASPAWDAHVLCDDDGRPMRWNGFLACPKFDFDNAVRIADWINRQQPTTVESDHLVWSGARLYLYAWDGNAFGDGDPKYERTFCGPDAEGFYTIGAFAWVWYEAETPACRACGWSQVGYVGGDFCPDCGEPFDWAGDV